MRLWELRHSNSLDEMSDSKILQAVHVRAIADSFEDQMGNLF